MSTVELIANTEALEHNARAAVEFCAGFDMEVWAVTKAINSLPPLVEALCRGGVAGIAESRIENIVRLRENGVTAPVFQIRSPALSEVETCVANATGSLNSDPRVLAALAAAAAGLDRSHEVVIMVDLDTGREGFPPEEVEKACRQVLAAPSLALCGLGVYFEYQGEADFHARSLRRLVELGERISDNIGHPLQLVSGGSTSIVRTQLLAGRKPAGVNHVRLGTAILLGIASSVGPLPMPGFRQDTFEVRAEIIELKRKDRLEGILGMGTIDADPEFLFPLDDGVRIIGASSDHTVVDLSDLDSPPQVGDRIAFRLGYYALCRLSISPFAEITYERNRR